MPDLSLDEAVELHHEAGDRIMRGDCEGYAALYSRQDDVTLGNPFGPFARGYDNVLDTLQGAAAHYRDGEATRVERISEHVTDDLACFVEVEHYRAKVGGRSDATRSRYASRASFARSKVAGSSCTATPIPSPPRVRPNR